MVKRPVCVAYHAWLELAIHSPTPATLFYAVFFSCLLPVTLCFAAFVPQTVKRRVQWWVGVFTSAPREDKKRFWVQPRGWRAWSHTVCPWSLSHKRTTQGSGSHTSEMCGTQIAVETGITGYRPSYMHILQRHSLKRTNTWAIEAFSRWALEPQQIAMLS